MTSHFERLLIDGDSVAFKAAASVETKVDWEDGEKPQYFADLRQAIDSAHAFIQTVRRDTGIDKYTLAFTSPDNFRRDILPSYKSNRTDKHKPIVLQQLRRFMREQYGATAAVPRLEADDVMGIVATREPGKYLLVSEDKDMLQIPGAVYNPRHGTFTTVTKESGDRWHLMQTLMGDPSDGYSGCPKIGKVKAAQILDVPPEDQWVAVLLAFKAAKAKGLIEGDYEEYALQQARVSKILQTENYIDGEIILWQPPEYLSTVMPKTTMKLP